MFYHIIKGLGNNKEPLKDTQKKSIIIVYPYTHPHTHKIHMNEKYY